MPLAGGGRSHGDEHVAILAHGHFGELEQSAGALDGQRDALADEHARPGEAALGDRGPAGARAAADRRGVPAGRRRLGQQLDRAIEAALVVAGVVRPAERGPVRELAHDVAAAQLDGIDRQLPGRGLDRRLDQVARLRPAGAAVGTGRDLVGARAGHDHLDGSGCRSSRRAASRSCAAGSPCSAAGRRRGRPAAGRAARGSARRRRTPARPPPASRAPAAPTGSSRAGPRPT